MARRPTKPRKREIENYAHTDKERVNNPPVGLVTPETDEDAGKKTYQHDPHIDPQRLRPLGLRGSWRPSDVHDILKAKAQRSGKQRIGFMAGEVEVPKDFDTMGGEDIRQMFE